MSNKSQLSESIDPDLLSDNNKWTILLLDQAGDMNPLAEAVEISNPYDIDLERFLPNTIPLTLPRFFDVASQLIVDAQKREGTVESERVQLIEEYPAEYMERQGDEVIAWRVLRREPAKMDAKGTGRPQRTSTFSYDLQSKYHPNKVIVVESRPIDHLIEFSCWAKSNSLANKRALWLEKLFVTHAWAFTVQGADRFFWENRGPDTYMAHGGQRLFYRPVNFMLRTREFEVKAHPVLKTVDFEVTLDRRS